MTSTTVSFSDVQGEPTYSRGRELGIFVYYTPDDQRWHIRWNGDEKGIPVTKYYYWSGQVVAEQVTNVQSQWFDSWQDEVYRVSPAGDVLSFYGVVYADEDGLDFSVQGDQVTFTLLGHVSERTYKDRRTRWAGAGDAAAGEREEDWGEDQVGPENIFLGTNKVHPASTSFTITLAATPPPPPTTPTLFWGNTYPSALKMGQVGSDDAPSDWLTLSQTPFGLAVDTATQQLYWGDGVPSINRANTDGTGLTPLATGLSFTPYGLAVDTANLNAYCADQNGGKIWRIHLTDGTAAALVTDLKMPVSVAVDLVNQHLYWVEYRGGCIKRADLAGGGVTTLVTDLDQPQSIALDVANNQMYWSAKTAVQCAHLDGSNLNESLIPLPQAASNTTSRTLTIDAANGWLYWTDEATNTIQQARTDGTQMTTLFADLQSPSQIAVLPA